MEVQKKTRRRFRQTQSLCERLQKTAEQARAAASQLGPNADRAHLLRKAMEAETTIRLEQWLSLPTG